MGTLVSTEAGTEATLAGEEAGGHSRADRERMTNALTGR